MKSTYLIGLLVIFSACTQGTKEQPPIDEGSPEHEIPKIILDTDIGGDIDDLGALYALHVYADSGLCEILGVMSSWAMAYHVEGIDAVNTYFGRPDIPVGRYEDEPFEKEEYTWFLGQKFESDLTYATAPPATDLYRKLLSESADSSVTIVVTGRLNNLGKLFESQPDSVSSLTGLELAHQKVKALYIMGGRYEVASENEANFRNGGAYTKLVIDSYEGPMIFNGGEIGHADMGYATGIRLNDLPDSRIIKAGYQYFFKNPPEWTGLQPADSIMPWSIWDIITVQVAVTGVKDYFEVVSLGSNQLDTTGINRWVTTPDKDHAYLIQKMDPKEYANDVIEPLFLVEAKAQR